MRSSISAKVTAIGFILIVLFGNLWLAYSLMGMEVPVWIQNGFMFGFLTAVIGGIGLVAVGSLNFFNKDSELENDTEDAGHTSVESTEE